jgi:tRNA/rRNA methyltransferase
MEEHGSTSRPELLQALGRLRVVLVDTKFSPNLGAMARILKNLGVADLRLVHPRAELNKEAYTMALGASDVLDRARFHARLPEALADCGLVIGTSRRHGVKRRNILSPRRAAEMLRPVLEAGEKAAVVFGSEDVGLSNDEAALCHWLVSIHPGTGFESLNLSHAAAIVLWEINQAVREWHPEAPKLASSRNLENMFQHLEEMLRLIGFIQEQDPRRMMLAVRHLLHRAGLSEREVKIIRGILRQTKWKMDHPGQEVMHPRLRGRG